MKRFYKYAVGLFLPGLIAVIMISPASAQRGGHSGGGGVRMGGGGGVGIHSSGSGVGFARTGSGVGFARGSSGAGIRGNMSYRGGTGYFAGRGYNAGAFYRPGWGYCGYPHLGFYLGVLPFGYYPFYWGSSLYYYYGGIFYSPYDNGGYQVTSPPIGAGIPNLPDNAQPIKIDGIQYYELNGVYYKEGVDDKGKKIYIVQGKDGVLNTDASVTDPNAAVSSPKIGDMVNRLPDDCRKVTLNGKKYFVSPNGIYYEKITDPDGNIAYRIASLPDDNDKGI